MSTAVLEKPEATSEVKSFTIDINVDLKDSADKILDSIGLSFPQAVDLFLRQMVLRNAFPVDLRARERDDFPLPCIDDMTEEELDALIQEAMKEFEAGRGISSEAIKEEMAKRYGIKF